MSDQNNKPGPPPPKCTPGWNDPPQVSASPVSTTKPKLTQRKFVSSIFNPAESTTTASPLDPKLDEVLGNLKKLVLDEPLTRSIADLPRQWKQPYCDDDMKEKLLQVSRLIIKANYQEAQAAINTFDANQLWFTVFFRNIITKVDCK